MKQIHAKNTSPERIDKVLAEELNLSRSKIQSLIKNGDVLVNNESVVPKHLVTENDVIHIDTEKAFPKKTIHPAPDLEVIYEDDDVVVINKPANLLVHETEVSDEPTLVDGLIKLHKETAEVGDKKERAGLVHRLDKPASGVLITAKTQEAFRYLKNQFKNRAVKKVYTVLVHGTMEVDHDTISMPISRAKTSGRMASKPVSQGGKEAITHYDVIHQYPHHALLRVQIETGRTHQIRSHFFALEHPVVGDTLYKQKQQKLLDIGRIFLHASELTITLPSGEEKTFVAPLPKELETVLEEIPKI